MAEELVKSVFHYIPFWQQNLRLKILPTLLFVDFQIEKAEKVLEDGAIDLKGEI